MKRGSTKVNFKEQVDLHSIKKKQHSATLSHMSSDTKHLTELNCEARQAHKFTGTKTAQSGPRGFLLLFCFFYLSASKCLTQSSQQALQPDAVNHFGLIPGAHGNTKHILDGKKTAVIHLLVFCTSTNRSLNPRQSSS